MMSTIEDPIGSGVNPMLETRVLDWILFEFRRGGKPMQGGACRRGDNEVDEGPASCLRAQVSGNYEEVSRERRRRCRGPHL
jgi:hypothetical protein